MVDHSGIVNRITARILNELNHIFSEEDLHGVLGNKTNNEIDQLFTIYINIVMQIYVSMVDAFAKAHQPEDVDYFMKSVKEAFDYYTDRLTIELKKTIGHYN